MKQLSILFLFSLVAIVTAQTAPLKARSHLYSYNLEYSYDSFIFDFDVEEDWKYSYMSGSYDLNPFVPIDYVGNFEIKFENDLSDLYV